VELWKERSKVNLARMDLKTEFKQKNTKEDEDKFKKFSVSKAHVNYLKFVLDLNDSVKGKTTTSKHLISDFTKLFVELLNEIDLFVDSTPPLNTPSRFGNPAFRTFLSKTTTGSASLVKKIVDSSRASTVVEDVQITELCSYLDNSFGNSLRIDYGSGHEMNFVCFIYCLYSLGFFSKDDFPALVLTVFVRYLSLVRRLQKTYWLEPAGSRGVWGLDDFQFLPFLWGAAQFEGHKYLKPKCVLDADVVECFAKDYIYLDCIKFINQVKVCSFAEHSPMLYDITIVKLWTKVNSGMIKMYKAEVLGKYAVVQHFIYSSFLPSDTDKDALKDWEEKQRLAATIETDSDHKHHDGGVGAPPCCSDVIRFPSAVAVSQKP